MAELDALIPDQELIDPEKPIEPDKLIEQFVPKEAHKHVPRQLIGLGSLALMLALLAIAWRWTPLHEWVNLASLVGMARSLDALPFTPIAILCSYVIAGLLMVPVTLLIAVTGIVFGPVLGTMYAITGALLSAGVSYGIGRLMGQDAVRHLFGQRINRLSQRISRRGIVAMTVIRMLPIAPFTVINVVAGALHINFRYYLIGTLLGMTPGIIVTVTFIHHLVEAVRNPSAGTVTVLAVVSGLLIGFALIVQHLLTGKKTSSVQ
jgi:uncharacterized membrane protein YdjX (TVP38/TMEM64 family)